MPIQSPNLDDRDFNQLLEDARKRVIQFCPEWTDLSPSDPGTVLLEVFAYLTDIMIYRLNRIPEKAYVEFLRLLGVQLNPPGAAMARLRFALPKPAETTIELPRGTRVTTSRAVSGTDSPVFVTARDAVIEAGTAQVEVLAHHCDLVIAELAGTGTGLPNQSVCALRPPMIARTGDELDLIVGVELTAREVDARAPAIQYQGKTYRIWREVDNFGNLGEDHFVYVADRIQGVIVFAPAAQLTVGKGQLSETSQVLAAVPPQGREIRMWYRRGGGPAGNVPANSLTVLKDPIPGVQVSNPERATGGLAAESLSNALVRGPQEFFALRRAVTARDFELVAERWGAVARARAVTKGKLWSYAVPGTVEVLLVPQIPEHERTGGKVSLANLVEHQTEVARAQIQSALNEQRPLGTTCSVAWSRYKSVRVKARVVAHPAEDTEALKSRIVGRLHATINPLPSQGAGTLGWRFGEALRAFHIYDTLVREPGVRYVDQVSLMVEDVPEKDVRSIAADCFQQGAWYAVSGPTVFRSLNDGEGWEPAGVFGGEEAVLVLPHPQKAGLVAVATRYGEQNNTNIKISLDCGETWRQEAQLSLPTIDIAWTMRDGAPLLLITTDKGLFELSLGATPVQVLVDSTNANGGFYSVVAAVSGRGGVSVAVASQSAGGVFLSTQGGKTGTFVSAGLKGSDVRELGVQYDGPRTFLWAGLAASAGDAGKGCLRKELLDTDNTLQEWRAFGDKWDGGSCRGLAFQGSFVLAATHRAGVLRLDVGKRDSYWEVPDVRCGLPLRDVGRLHPVDGVAADPQGRLVLAVGVEGVYRSMDRGLHYEMSSRREFENEVRIPENWLICSGDHEIEVTSGDDKRRD